MKMFNSGAIYFSFSSKQTQNFRFFGQSTELKLHKNDAKPLVEISVTVQA